MKSKIFGLFDREKLRLWILYWGVLGFGFITLTFVVTSVWIGFSVKDHCLAAQGKYEGDCVEALARVLDDEENSLRERNTATWALGQMGDERALETLQKYYTGDIPDREPYDETLSQYELKKAINLIESGLNVTHLIWSPDNF